MRFLGNQATLAFSRLGYSNRMTAEAKREGEWWLRARTRALTTRVGLVSGWAVVWPNAGSAELVPIDVPLAGPGEVTVEVTSSMVSPGTEKAYYLRLPNAVTFFPHRPGYSAAGIVVGVGDGVSHVSPGDPVAVTGAPHASVATVPASSVFEVPAGVSLEEAALVQVGVIAAQGVRQAAIAPTEHVTVIGAGLIGALAQRLALAGGAARATIIATSRAKERVVNPDGDVRFLVTGTDDERIAALASPVVIEATGDPSAVTVAAAAAGAGGRVVLLGSSRGTTRDLPVDAIRDKQLRMVGAHTSGLAREAERTGVDVIRREAAAFLQTLAQHRVSVSDLVDVVIDPREAGAFYRDLVRDRAIVGARFDWASLPRAERAGRRSFWHPPDLSGRGVESERKPLPAARRAAQPFAEARGRLRFGLLGCGDIGVQNAAAIAMAPNTELVACYDPATKLATEVAESHGADVALSAEALFEHPNVDAVFLAVPHHLHAPLALQAAACGRHIVVEKPLANTLAAAREMVEGAERAGVALSVCFPLRYRPEVVAARRLIAAGALGKFGGALLNVCDDKPPSYWLGGFSGRSVSDWRASREKAGGGALIMNLSHYIDLLRSLVGSEVEELTAVASAVDQPAEVEDTVSVTLRYANGAVASLFGCTAVRGTRSTDLRVWGNLGHLKLEPSPQVFSLRPVEGLRAGRWHELSSASQTNVSAEYVSRFATAVTEGRAPEVTALDGLAVQAIVEAAYRSSDTGESVRPADLLELTVA